ncbi:MAG TPA: hypothetical protein VMH03_16595 [Terriglobales bacterium]|nr:hypothetical protein [Terriglobales bacterium]
MKRNPILRTLGCALAAAPMFSAGLAPAQVAGDKPNIVFILMDNLGYDDPARALSAQTLRSVFIGCALGCFALLHLIRSLLFAVSPMNPFVLGGTCLLLIVVALLATWLPTHRPPPLIGSKPCEPNNRQH